MTFSKIFGQETIFARLLELIREERADSSYIFTGPRGVGKWAYGLRFISAYCCEDKSKRPCGICENCKAVAKFKHPDIQFLFPFPNIDASKKQVTVFPFSDPASGAKFSQTTAEEVQRFLREKAEDPYRIVRFEAKTNIPVDVVRDLRKFLSLRPMWGGKKAVLMSDIENMAPHCTDLLLKTIEEPPRDTAIILTSSTPERLPITIISRCRVFAFGALDENEVRQYLSSLFKGAKLDYRFINRASGFSPGVARALVEQDAVSLRDKVLSLMKSAIKDHSYFDNSFIRFESGFDLVGEGINVLTLLAWILRDIVVMHSGGGVEEIINCDRAEIMAGLANQLPAAEAQGLLEDLGDIKIALEHSNVMPTTASRHLLAVMRRRMTHATMA